MYTMENDTVALLKECNSGIKMGIRSLTEVLDKVQASDLREILKNAKEEHEKLGDESHAILLKYHEDGKEPHPVAKMMSDMKTGMKLTMQESDATVADLITDGCDMGIKSLHRYLNQYPEAEECVQELTGKLIDSEEKLRKNLQCYL